MNCPKCGEVCRCPVEPPPTELPIAGEASVIEEQHASRPVLVLHGRRSRLACLAGRTLRPAEPLSRPAQSAAAALSIARTCRSNLSNLPFEQASGRTLVVPGIRVEIKPCSRPRWGATRAAAVAEPPAGNSRKGSSRRRYVSRLRIPPRRLSSSHGLPGRLRRHRPISWPNRLVIARASLRFPKLRLRLRRLVESRSSPSSARNWKSVPASTFLCRAAPLGLRFVAALIDGLIVAAASALFGFIFWKSCRVSSAAGPDLEPGSRNSVCCSGLLTSIC